MWLPGLFTVVALISDDAIFVQRKNVDDCAFLYLNACMSLATICYCDQFSYMSQCDEVLSFIGSEL